MKARLQRRTGPVAVLLMLAIALSPLTATAVITMQCRMAPGPAHVCGRTLLPASADVTRAMGAMPCCCSSSGPERKCGHPQGAQVAAQMMGRHCSLTAASADQDGLAVLPDSLRYAAPVDFAAILPIAESTSPPAQVRRRGAGVDLYCPPRRDAAVRAHGLRAPPAC